MTTHLDTILKETYTLSDLKSRFRALKARLQAQIFASPILEESLSDLEWLNSLGDDFYAQFNKNNLTLNLSDLDQQIQSINPLIIDVAFEPQEEQVTQLGSWIRQNINPNLVMEIKYNPELIAGCSLVWKGVLRDYSLKYTIDQNKDQILSMFREYLR